MKIVVLGATGFIGRHLSERLSGAGVEVVAVGHRLGAVRVDLADPSFTASLPGDADAIVHLAQSSGRFPDDAERLYEVNAVSVLRTLAFATRAGIPSVVIASSGSVYGVPPTARAWREDDPCAPADFYAMTKRHAEEFAARYASLVRVAIVRLFAPYGPGQTARLVAGLIDRVAAGQPVTVPADGPSLRLNPIYVDDAVDALSRLVHRGEGGTYNLGGPEVLSIEAMAAAIGRRLGVEPQFEAKGEAAVACVGDITRIAREVGVTPAVPFEEGIARTIAARASRS